MQEQLLELKRLYLERLCGSCFTELKPLRQIPQIYEKKQNLQELTQTIKTCHLCELSKGKDSPNAGFYVHGGVVFVSEIPLNASSGLPMLVSRSGEMLQDMIEKVLQLSLKEVSFLSLLKCTPLLGQKVSEGCLQSCVPYLFEQLTLLQPKLIVALGENVAGTFFKMNGDFESIRGKMEMWEGIRIVAIHSPRFLLRNPSFKREAYRDLLFIKSLI